MRLLLALIVPWLNIFTIGSLLPAPVVNRYRLGFRCDLISLCAESVQH